MIFPAIAGKNTLQIIKLCIFVNMFCSPEQKAQESFSSLFAVRRLSVCLSVNLITFYTFSPELLVRFQPNVAQCLLRLRGFELFKWKAPPSFEGKTLKIIKYLLVFFGIEPKSNTCVVASSGVVNWRSLKPWSPGVERV